MRLIALLTIIAMSACAPTSSVQNNITALKEDVRATNTVTVDEAFAALEKASLDTPGAENWRERSIAQVVFPRIAKAGIIIGGNYGEGYLIRNNRVVGLVDVAGANVGFQAGIQNYSQVTYIFSEGAYSNLVNNGNLSLSGTLSYGRQGRIENTAITTENLGESLRTLVFNETGTVFGASVEGLYYTYRDMDFN
jgi:lipid-binding SYLF domain-containing protein